MTQALQALLILGVVYGLAKWGLYRGRKEREREQCDVRQASIHFPDARQDDEQQHRGVAMSHL